jgi:hypothetical protein
MFNHREVYMPFIAKFSCAILVSFFSLHSLSANAQASSTASGNAPPQALIDDKEKTKMIAPSSTTRAVEITFLKSLPGKLGQLEKFIKANWFPPDEIAVKEGIMVSYEWLDSGNDEGTYNAMVVITYPNEGGFVGIKPLWDKLITDYRRDNKRVLIDGLGFTDLGKIVESRKFYERAPLMSKRSKL